MDLFNFFLNQFYELFRQVIRSLNYLKINSYLKVNYLLTKKYCLNVKIIVITIN